MIEYLLIPRSKNTKLAAAWTRSVMDYPYHLGRSTGGASTFIRIHDKKKGGDIFFYPLTKQLFHCKRSKVDYHLFIDTQHII